MCHPERELWISRRAQRRSKARAQDDSLWRPVRFKKPPRVSRKGRPVLAVAQEASTLAISHHALRVRIDIHGMIP